jgi:hypothetical protein
MVDYDTYNNMSSQALHEIYQKQASGTMRATLPGSNHLIKAFLSPSNIRYMVQEIERVASEKCGFPVRLQLDSDVVGTIIRVALSNGGFSRYPLAQAIAYMNAQVIQHEAFIAFQSIVRKKLYYKYYIEKDRMMVMPYGVATHEPKGDTILESSGYTLSHPWKRARPEALLFGNGMIPSAKSTIDNPYVAPIVLNPSYITDTSRVPPPKEALSIETLSQMYSDPSNQNQYAPIYGYLQPKNSSFPGDI